MATDIDYVALATAAQNVESNPQLKDRIDLLFRSGPDSLIPDQALDNNAIERSDGRLARFTMCNPPFYCSRDDMEKSAFFKKLPPSSVFLGDDHETITEGGELIFINRMIDESIKLAKKIQWYSTMIGLAGTVKQVIANLKRARVEHYISATLKSGGNQTRRWVIAWTFDVWRPPMDTIYSGEKWNQSAYDTEFSIDDLSGNAEADLHLVEHAIFIEMQVKWDYNPATRIARIYIPADGAHAYASGVEASSNGPSRDIDSVGGRETWVQMRYHRRQQRFLLRWVKGPSVHVFQQFCERLRSLCCSPQNKPQESDF